MPGALRAVPAPSSSRNSLGSVVAHCVDRPRIFDDEEGYPLPLLYIDEVDATDKDRDRVDDEKGDVELHLVPRGRQVVGDIQKPIFW